MAFKLTVHIFGVHKAYEPYCNFMCIISCADSRYKSWQAYEILTDLPMELFMKATGIMGRKMGMVFSLIQMVHSMMV